MWPSSSSSTARQINYGVPTEMGMFVVAPASSFHNPHHHHQHHHDHINLPDPHSINSSNAATALGVGVGVIPLLTSTPCLGVEEDMLNGINRGRSSNIQFWQPQQQQQQLLPNYLKKPAAVDHGFLHSGGGGGGSGTVGLGGGGSSSNSASTMTCQDCGNQAKKDCSHRRCRTCCKSRGFDCATHVRSTWVPAARRRERQLMTASGVKSTAAAGSSASTSGAKKPRLTSQTTTTSHTSTSTTTPPRSFDTSSSHQDASFKEALPGQVRAPAVFKCVRVTAVDDGDGDDEYAYQAVVKIGGHVFKGFLYDQGAVETREAVPNLSELHLGGGSGGGSSGGGGRNVASSSLPMLDPPDVYAASGGGGGGLLGGSTYG